MLELRSQIEDWKNHLPNSLRFPVSRNHLFDSRRAQLRCQFHALIAVVTWPFVLWCENLSEDRQSLDKYFLNSASECLQACEAYLHSAEEILTHKSLESHLVVRG